MSRPIQPGDFVLITHDDFAQYYQIRSITPTEIRISPPNKPGEISVLTPDPNFSNQWKVYGTDIDFQMEFLSRETYNEKMKQLSHFLSLPHELIIQMAIDMDLDDVTKLCQSHTKLNEILCNNQDFWKMKYHHDFDELTEIPFPENVNWNIFYKDRKEKERQDQIEEIKRTPIYGIFYKDKNELKIVKTKSRLNHLFMPSDPIEKLCLNMRRSEILGILWNFKIPPPVDEPIPSGWNQFDFKNYLKENEKTLIISPLNSANELKFCYKWSRLKYTRFQMCDILKTYFRENNLLIVI